MHDSTRYSDRSPTRHAAIFCGAFPDMNCPSARSLRPTTSRSPPCRSILFVLEKAQLVTKRREGKLQIVGLSPAPLDRRRETSRTLSGHLGKPVGQAGEISGEATMSTAVEKRIDYRARARCAARNRLAGLPGARCPQGMVGSAQWRHDARLQSRFPRGRHIAYRRSRCLTARGFGSNGTIERSSKARSR